MKKTKLPKQFLIDAAALAAYEPRKQAIEWILAGKVDKALSWELTDGRKAAGRSIPRKAEKLDRLRTFFRSLDLDTALMLDRLPDACFKEHEVLAAAEKLCHESIDRFMESPFEMALRAASDAAFDRWLSVWRRREVPESENIFWEASFDMPVSANGIDHELLARTFARLQRSMFGWKLLTLALAIGRTDRAEKMLSCGMGPASSMDWARYYDSLVEMGRKCDQQALAALFRVESFNVDGFIRWSKERWGIFVDKDQKAPNDGAVKPTPKLSEKEVGRELSKLHGQFEKLFKRLDPWWYGNFENSHNEIVNFLRKADSDVWHELAEDIYINPPESKDDLSELEGLTCYQKDRLTEFGLVTAKVRYCIGYLGNIKHGQDLLKDECESLIFAYEAYWKHGDNFVFGGILDNALQRLGDPVGWQKVDWLAKGRDAKDIATIGMKIAEAMWDIYWHHRPGQAFAVDLARAEKPVFRDFRVEFSKLAPD